MFGNIVRQSHFRSASSLQERLNIDQIWVKIANRARGSTVSRMNLWLSDYSAHRNMLAELRKQSAKTNRGKRERRPDLEVER
jgi:hypothetical protein